MAAKSCYLEEAADSGGRAMVTSRDESGLLRAAGRRVGGPQSKFWPMLS
jgi:hypothetical protein